MTDKPIPFTGPMVRAILAGLKTQTRRLIKVAPPEATSAGTTYSTETGHSNTWTWLSGDPRDADTWEMLGDFRLPYKPGDRLYVREHWRTGKLYDDTAPRDLRDGAFLHYIADGAEDKRTGVGRNGQYVFGRFRQGMHMPRWASRITLHVTGVRVQRLLDISEADAMAEGYPGSNGAETIPPLRWYCGIWEAINGAGSWEKNPWVAAYTFEVERCNIAQARKAA